MTWYEWGFYAIKLYDQSKLEKDRRELFLAVTRIMIKDFKNANFKYPGGPVKEEDIFRLSFDKPAQDERPLTFKEAKALFGSRIRKDGK